MGKIKFPLEMANGEQARNLKDLQDNFDIEKVVGYFLDGKLQTWLEDRYYEDEAEAVANIDKDDTELAKRLCEIFDVEITETESVNAEEIAEKNARIEKLKQFTDDEEIIRNIDLVAFNQEELSKLYDSGATKIYLCEGEFNIPKSKQDLEYVKIGCPKVNGEKVIYHKEIKIIMPKPKQSVESCIISKWYKQKGDKVEVGDLLFTYETDKATFDEEAKVAGTLLDIFYEEGDDVQCQKIIGYIRETNIIEDSMPTHKNTEEQVVIDVYGSLFREEQIDGKVLIDNHNGKFIYDNHNIYKIYNGNKVEILSNYRFNYKKIISYGSFIIFSHSERRDGGLYIYDISKDVYNSLDTIEPTDFILYNNKIYYAKYVNNEYKCKFICYNLDNYEKQILGEVCNVSSNLRIVGDRLYFDSSEMYGLKKYQDSILLKGLNFNA